MHLLLTTAKGLRGVTFGKIFSDLRLQSRKVTLGCTGQLHARPTSKHCRGEGLNFNLQDSEMPEDALTTAPQKLGFGCRLAPPVGASSLLMRTLVHEK